MCLVKVLKTKLILTNSFSKECSCDSFIFHLFLQFRLLVWFSSFYLVLESKKIKMLTSLSKTLHHMLKNSYRVTDSDYLSRQGTYIQLKQQGKNTSTQMQTFSTNNIISSCSPCGPQQLHFSTFDLSKENVFSKHLLCHQGKEILSTAVMSTTEKPCPTSPQSRLLKSRACRTALP